MLIIHLIRHGETDWNAQNKVQGSVDIPLNELGKKQAEIVGAYLKRYEFDALYSSDLSRAFETAQSVLTHQKLHTIVQSSLIREIGYGVWEGLTWEEIADKGWHKELEDFRRDPIQNRPPQGETIDSLLDRTKSFLEEIAIKHPSGRICVVAHGGTIRAFLTHALNADKKTWGHMRLGNCSESIITIDHTTGHTEALKVNDTSYILEHARPAGSLR